MTRVKINVCADGFSQVGYSGYEFELPARLIIRLDFVDKPSSNT